MQEPAIELLCDLDKTPQFTEIASPSERSALALTVGFYVE